MPSAASRMPALRRIRPVMPRRTNRPAPGRRHVLPGARAVSRNGPKGVPPFGVGTPPIRDRSKLRRPAPGRCDAPFRRWSRGPRRTRRQLEQEPATRTGEWHVTTQRARSGGNSPRCGTRSVTDDKPPPQRRGGPGGRRVLPPSGRPVARKWIGRSGGPEHDGSPAPPPPREAPDRAVLGVKPHACGRATSPARIRQVILHRRLTKGCACPRSIVSRP